MMKQMKKWIACAVALLMAVQMAPALAAEDQYISNVQGGTLAGFREALQIVSEGGAYLLEGEALELTTNEMYEPIWESSNSDIVMVEEGGSPAHAVTVYAMDAGEAVITATAGEQTSTISVTVLAPEELMADDGAEEETDGEGNPVRKPKMIIVINGGMMTAPYTGEEQTFGEYTATSSSELFDAEKVKTNRDIEVKGTACGYYQMMLTKDDFRYEDDAVKAVFVVNDGYLKINPAIAVVTPDDAEKQFGQDDPELTAKVAGLLSEEDTIAYTLTRDEGEETGSYTIRAEGDEIQGNYRVEFLTGVLTIQKADGRKVKITSSLPRGAEAYVGTEVTLTAHIEGFEDTPYTVQWQYSVDRENWTDVPGANELEYTFALDVENATYAWRVLVTDAAE